MIILILLQAVQQSSWDISKMAKFVKKRGVDFKHIEWEISEVHSVKVRRNIPRETLCALDRVLICKSHVTTVSYCCACVDYANIVLNMAKTKNKEVPIQNEVHCQTTPSEFQTDTECQTEFPKYTDRRGN